MVFAKVDDKGRAELKEALKKAEKTKWYRRLKSVQMSSEGQTITEIAEFFDLNYNTIRSYINRYNAGGLDGLKPNYGPGRPITVKLSKQELMAVMERSPSQFEKLETGARNWNQGLMQQYLLAYHQTKISQSAISNLFKRLGIPWNRAKKK